MEEKDNKTKVPDDVLEFAKNYIEEISKTPTEYQAKFKIALENLHLYYDKVLPRLATPGVSTQEVVEMLVEACLVEKNFDEGLEVFLRSLFSEGVEIETDQVILRKWIERLSNLRLYRKIIHLMGLGAFEQELIEIEIKRTMEPGKQHAGFLQKKDLTKGG